MRLELLDVAHDHSLEIVYVLHVLMILNQRYYYISHTVSKIKNIINGKII